MNTAKWLATATLILGSGVNGLGYYPAGPVILVLGGVVWLLIAVKIKDWALVTTNAVMSLVSVVTVVYTLQKLEIDHALEKVQPQTCSESELRLLLPSQQSQQPELVDIAGPGSDSAST